MLVTGERCPDQPGGDFLATALSHGIQKLSGLIKVPILVHFDVLKLETLHICRGEMHLLAARVFVKVRYFFDIFCTFAAAET